MRTIHPRLEEIRKRLLMTPDPSAPPRYVTPKRPGEIFSTDCAQQPQRVESEDTVNLYKTLRTRSSTSPDPNIEEAHIVERGTANLDEPAARGTSQSLDGLARAVAALFEPARQCQGRLAEITEASESISYLSRVALELCEPLKSFHEHIKTLSRSFESMRTFRDELNVLAESFPPVRALHAQVIQLAETVRTHLAELADGFEPAKVLQADILELALAMDSVNKLQAEFYSLSKAFGDGTDPSVANTQAAEDSPA
jgi:hypothetical protein